MNSIALAVSIAVASAAPEQSPPPPFVVVGVAAGDASLRDRAHKLVVATIAAAAPDAQVDNRTLVVRAAPAGFDISSDRWCAVPNIACYQRAIRELDADAIFVVDARSASTKDASASGASIDVCVRDLGCPRFDGGATVAWSTYDGGESRLARRILEYAWEATHTDCLRDYCDIVGKPLDGIWLKPDGLRFEKEKVVAWKDVEAELVLGGASAGPPGMVLHVNGKPREVAFKSAAGRATAWQWIRKHKAAVKR